MPLKIPPFTPVPIKPTSAEPFSTFVTNTPAAQTPLTGTELVPLIQNGQSVHTSPTSFGGGSSSLTVGTTPITGGTNGDVLYDNNGVLGEQPIALKVATSNLTFYVATTGSDSNDGSSAHPFATIQHAVSVALSFNYQGIYLSEVSIADGTYRETINIPNNPFNAASPDGYSLEISGNDVTPANVKIAPNAGVDTDVFSALNGLWNVHGINFVADPGVTAGNSNIVKFANSSAAFENIVFSTGSTSTYSTWLFVSSYSRVFNTTDITINGNGAAAGAGFYTFNFSRYALFGTLTFSSAINLSGSNVFAGDTNSDIDLRFVSFVTPGNVTNSDPISLINESLLALNVDPTTVTWPGGAFDPTQVDGGSNIDGNFFAHKYAGAPVDESSIYRGSWQIHKDTTGGGTYVAADDGGKILLNAFAASAAFMHANMGGL